jgi:hypothetical protein
MVGFEGLGEKDIASMTKHRQDKLSDVYMPELKRKVLKTMSGFEEDKAWYVGRCYVGTPPGFETKFLFPYIDRWISEVNSPVGDKGAQNFVYSVLPYFATVAAQDGIYWTRDFPNHEVSLYLSTQIPNYIQWARTMLPEII